MSRIVVLGGGYAGLACLIELSKKAPQLELHLVDGAAEHCKITNLHKTFKKPIEEFRVPYAQLTERFNFSFHQHKVTFTATELQRWQQADGGFCGRSERSDLYYTLFGVAIARLLRALRCTSTGCSCSMASLWSM